MVDDLITIYHLSHNLPSTIISVSQSTISSHLPISKTWKSEQWEREEISQKYDDGKLWDNEMVVDDDGKLWDDMRDGKKISRSYVIWELWRKKKKKKRWKNENLSCHDKISHLTIYHLILPSHLILPETNISTA